MTDHPASWRDARVDPPTIGAPVIVRDVMVLKGVQVSEELRTFRWSEKSAKRFRWWLPREVLP